jgi:recombination protein RecT
MTENAIALSPAKQLAQNLSRMEQQFNAVLPPGVNREKFMRVTLTAVQNNPRLLDADRSSLYHACHRAAQDGLLPDGREGVFNVYRTKEGDSWVAKVQWLPMVAGRRKQFYKHKVTVDAQVVYANDEFRYTLGDDAKIIHVPMLGGDRGEMMLAYAIATLPDGRKVREVMTREDILRAKASARDSEKDYSPWQKHAPEMWRKTVINRIAKILYGLEGFDEIAESITREHMDAGVEGMFDEDMPVQDPEPQEPVSAPERETRAAKIVKAQQAKKAPPPIEDDSWAAEYEAAEQGREPGEDG